MFTENSLPFLYLPTTNSQFYIANKILIKYFVLALESD